uniref:H15 domain-containing protein n=1 Tax=Glossina austeni TaxID=7395 RepID=A0A1A9V7B0_GLOAU
MASAIHKYKLLFKYPKLWGVNSEWVNWEVDCRQLAATLTGKLGYRVTTNDVRFKVKAIKLALRKLDKSKGTARTRLGAFLWYALRLGLRYAADRITQQLISDGQIKINIRRFSEDLIGFEETDTVSDRWVPYLNEMIDERIREIVTATFGGTTGEETTADGIQRPAKVDNREIDYYFDDEGPSTSAKARQRLAEWQIEREQPEQELVDLAILKLKEKDGSSVPAIKKAIMVEYPETNEKRLLT